jgi:hypothetical protein
MTPGYVLAAAGAETTEGASAVIDFQSALMLMVLVCLAFMAKALADLSRRVREIARTRAGEVSAGGTGGRSAAADSPARATGTPPTPEELAVITAAVYAALDRPLRIVAVDEVRGAQSAVWSLEGRRQIFSSHRVR